MANQHAPTPWVIPAGEQNGFIICKGDDPAQPGEILMVLRSPNGRKSVLTDSDINDNAAFIVKAVNNHEAMDKLLAEAADFLNNSQRMEAMDLGNKITQFRFALQKQSRPAVSGSGSDANG